MQYSYLPSADLSISKIGFGCGPLGGVDWGAFDEKQTMSAVSKALDLGINHFDTADVYGLGRSEELLSKALGSRRKNVVIATKFGVNWSQDYYGGRARTFYDSSTSRITEALENSLRRLQLDSIPLYYIHWPDPNTPFSDTMEALIRCQESGKVQHIGLSNFSSSQIKKIHKDLHVDVVQAQYSLIDRAAEKELLLLSEQLGLNIITYGALAQGLLTGKYKGDTKFGDDDCRQKLRHFHGDDFEQHSHVIDKLVTMSNKYGVSVAQIALRWVLENPYISCAIAGIKTIEQIVDNAASLEWSIDSDDKDFFYKRLDKYI